MKRLVIFAVSALVAGAAVDDCSAQVFGNFSPSRTVDQGGRSAGAYFTVADDIVGAIGQFRYGATGGLDLGLQMGLESADERVFAGGLYREKDETHLLVAGDGKYMIRSADDEIPIDLSVDFGVGLVNAEHADRLLFSIGGQGGWRGPEPESRGLEPYLGLTLMVDRISLDLPQGDRTDTDNDLEVRLGTAFRLSAAASVLAELQAGDETSFGVGLNFSF